MRLFLAVLTLLFAAHPMAQAAPMHVAFDSQAPSGYGCYNLTTNGGWQPVGPLTHGANGLMLTRVSKYADRADHATLAITVWSVLPGDVVDEKMRVFNELRNSSGAKLGVVTTGPYSGQTCVYPTTPGQAGGPTTVFIGLRLGLGYLEATAQYTKPPSAPQIASMEQMLGTLTLPPMHMPGRKAAHP